MKRRASEKIALHTPTWALDADNDHVTAPFVSTPVLATSRGSRTTNKLELKDSIRPGGQKKRHLYKQSDGYAGDERDCFYSRTLAGVVPVNTLGLPGQWGSQADNTRQFETLPGPIGAPLSLATKPFKPQVIQLSTLRHMSRLHAAIMFNNVHKACTGAQLSHHFVSH